MVCVWELQIVQGHWSMKFEAGEARGVWVTGSQEDLVQAPHFITRECTTQRTTVTCLESHGPVSG